MGMRNNRFFRLCRNVLFVTLWLLGCANGVDAQDTGYVVGRVYLQIDGYQGVSGHIVEPVKLVVARVLDEQLEKIETQTDEKGHFVLENQPMDAFYYPYSIHGSAIDQPLPSVIPDPSTSNGLAGVLYRSFSSTQEALPGIIDCGETVIILSAMGNLSVERYYGRNFSVLDYDRAKPFEKKRGTFGYAGLLFYSQIDENSTLRATARLALKDRKAFDRAEPLKLKGDKLRYKKREKAVGKYREAIEAYPAYEEAYLALASTVSGNRRLAIKLLRKGLEYRPASYELTLALGKVYVETGQLEEAKDCFKQLLQQSDRYAAKRCLVQAYVKAGDTQTALRYIKQQNQSLLYYGGYQVFMAAYRFKEAYYLLKEAIAHHADGTFDVELPILALMLADMPTQVQNARYFVKYLKDIQQDGDCSQWNKHPYDRYIERNPAASLF